MGCKQRSCSKNEKGYVLKMTNRFQDFMEENAEEPVEERVSDNFLSSIRYLYRNMAKKVKKVTVTQKLETENESFTYEADELSNLCQTLEDKSEDLNILINEVKIEQTPKRLLKKCRKCNFKKRTCFLNSSKCKASLRSCFACHKVGHYPQSSDCKVRRRRSLNRCPQTCLTNLASKPIRINLKSMELIKAKIHQLEMERSFQKALSLQFEELTKTKEETCVPKDLIPFLMLYVFLNYDCIFPNQSIKNRKQAKKKFCWKCKKQGHYPQSLCWKEKRMASRRKLIGSNKDTPKSTLIKKKDLNLIIRTQERLENLINLERYQAEEDDDHIFNQTLKIKVS